MRPIILIVSMVFICATANAQEKESLAKTLNKKGGYYFSKGNYDSSLFYHRRALKIAGDRDFAETGQALLGIAEDMIRNASNDSALYYLDKALAIAKEHHDRLSEAGIYNTYGNLYLEANKFTRAQENFFKAANLYDSLPSQEEGLGKALVNIGNVENILNNPEKAIEYTQRSIVIFKEKNDSTKLAYCYKLMARIYRKQKDFQKSLGQYNEALKIYVSAGFQHEISETLQGMGNLYYDLQQYDKALEQYFASLRIARQIHDENQLAYTYNAIAFAWYATQQPAKSLVYFDSALQKARQVHNRYLVMDSYETLSGLYEEQDQPKRSLEYLHAFVMLKDSLISEENRRVLAETEALYQNAKKQGEIEVLQKEREQNQLFVWALVIVIVLIVIIGVLIFNRFRIISNTRRLLEIERVRDHIGRDLHDDIGSTLSTIAITSRFAIDENKPENYIRHFQTIDEQSSKMLENMSDIVWSINPVNDSMENMIMRMREFCAEILEPKNIEYAFHGVEMFKDVLLSLESRKNIFLIFKESINNAAKYSNAGLINIRFVMIGKTIRFSIEDNGDGFQEHSVKAGNGLRNMRERAKSIGASIEIRSEVGKGTFLELCVGV